MLNFDGFPTGSWPTELSISPAWVHGPKMSSLPAMPQMPLAQGSSVLGTCIPVQCFESLHISNQLGQHRRAGPSEATKDASSKTCS